jgi:choice-of-anchor B domain-containing protein
MKLFLMASLLMTLALSGQANEGVAASNIILKQQLNLVDSGIKSKRGNDIWGWTDPLTGKEYAMMGMDNKTSFIDVTDARNPIHLADLKTHTSASIWRDIKVYKNHAYVVSEAKRHGMQIFDLTRLRTMDGASVVKVKADGHYAKFGSAHNIAINEDSGYAYAVGTSTCDGGLHIINIKKPMQPSFVNCIGRGVYELPRNIKDGDAYTHDVQCVIYHGPDKRYLGKEICIASNEDTVNIVDVTNKAKPYQISVATYKGVRYTHQGWLTEDHEFYLLGDELDEKKYSTNTKTFIWNFSDLENPKHLATHTHKTRSIDHNMYVKGNYVYQANYSAGLRILDLTDVSKGKLNEVGYLDTVPNSDRSDFKGIWSIFPYFSSGTVIASGVNGVLYVAKPTNLK